MTAGGFYISEGPFMNGSLLRGRIVESVEVEDWTLALA